MAGKLRGPVTEETTWRSYSGTPRHIKDHIFQRDGYTCQYCGIAGENVILEADHRIPRRLGGPNVVSNLVTACRPCNRSKQGHTVGCWRQPYSCAYRFPYRDCVLGDFEDVLT